jgi:hypothetical protein
VFYEVCCSPSEHNFGTDRIENTACNSFVIIVFVFLTAETCVPSRCLSMDWPSGVMSQYYFEYKSCLFRLACHDDLNELYFIKLRAVCRVIDMLALTKFAGQTTRCFALHALYYPAVVLLIWTFLSFISR